MGTLKPPLSYRGFFLALQPPGFFGGGLKGGLGRLLGTRPLGDALYCEGIPFPDGLLSFLPGALCLPAFEVLLRGSLCFALGLPLLRSNRRGVGRSPFSFQFRFMAILSLGPLANIFGREVRSLFASFPLFPVNFFYCPLP